ncbi:MAG: ABC transporter substrate-binding protein [Planctomycetes bacterium]|nr:ABC transporter substrate-binding protein [Planctomycetota bacterium]
MRNTLLLAAIIATVTITAAACKSDIGPGFTNDKVTLGLFVSTSGDIATFGQDTKNGAELAVEEINKAGGISKHLIDLRFQDCASEPAQGGNAATKLITQDGVLIGMGEVASGISLAAAPIFQKYGVPMISPSSTNPTVTQQGDMIFRICYLDDFQGAACALFANQNLNCKTAAILMNQDDAYSTGLGKFFRFKFEKLGGKIVAEETFKKGASDFNTQLTNIKGKNPDVIFAPVYYQDIPLIAKQARGQGIDKPLLGGDGWESDDLLPKADGKLDNCYFANHYATADDAPIVANFVKAYNAKYGSNPTSLAALGYDVVYVAKKAIESAGGINEKLTRKAVADALRGLKDFEGVTGTFSIDKNRDARKPIQMLKIKDGKVLPDRRIRPEEVE